MICTDGNASYPKAIRKYFGTHITYSQLVKVHKDAEVIVVERQVSGPHVVDKVSTSFVERFNLTMRMSVRRYSRKTNGFSKTIENHKNMVDLFALYYNFIRLHETLGTTPAVAAGLVSKPRTFEWLIGKIDRMHQRDRQRIRLTVR